MKIETFRPAIVLQPFVRQFLIIESDVLAVNKILPDTTSTIVFRLNVSQSSVDKARTKVPLSIISGLTSSLRSINYLPGDKTLIVQFTEVGAAAFFRQPLHLFFNTKVILEDVFPKSIINEIEERLFESQTDVQRLQIVEHFLIPLLASESTDLPMTYAIDEIKKAKGIVNIKQLSGFMYMSLDSFEKRFRKITGTSPKHFATIIRLRHAVDIYPTVKNLTKIAHQSGYFDQSHFIKDFKLFTGQTPGAFFSTGNFW